MVKPLRPLMIPAAGAACAWSNDASQSVGQFVINGTGAQLNQIFENQFIGTTNYPGAVIASLGRSGGKRFFEVFYGPEMSGSVSGKMAACGLSPALNMTFPFEYGVSGAGIQYATDGTIVDTDSGVSTTGPTWGPSDVIGWAVDLGNLLAWPTKNGAAVVGNPAAGTGGLSILRTTYFPGAWIVAPNNDTTAFASGHFSPARQVNAPPTGFLMWAA